MAQIFLILAHAMASMPALNIATRSLLTASTLALFYPLSLAQSVDWELVYTGEVLRNHRGGLSEETRYLDNIDLTMQTAIDSDNALHLPAGKLFAWAIYNNSNRFSAESAGDIQGASNIDNSYTTRLHELWYEIPIATTSTIKLGLMDLNIDFDSIDTASLFLNSSHGIGVEYSQSGQNGPSIFPSTSLGVAYTWSRANWTWRLATLDGVPGDPDHPRRTAIKFSSDDGALVASELNYQKSQTHFGLGVWAYSEPSETNDQLSTARNKGVYGFVEHLADSSDTSGVSWWLRFGRAQERVNPTEYYFGAGIVFPGPGNRTHDEFGIAVALATATESFLESSTGLVKARTAPSETALELTYRYHVSDKLSLQPDLQYIFNPSYSSSLNDALVFGIRAQWTPF